MILAQQLESGDVRYIRLARHDYTDVTPILKTFYTKESRASALLDLGSIYQLGPSPYGKYKFRELDVTHCIANIRDQRESRGRNIAKYASLSELQNIEGHKFLYKDGAWHYFDGTEFTASLPIRLSGAKENPMKGLEMRTFNREGDIVNQYNDFKSWNEAVEYSTTEGKPIFIFRGNKLITTINHPKHN